MAKGTAKKRRARLAKKESDIQIVDPLRISNDEDNDNLEGIYILSNEVLVEICLQLPLVDLLNLSMVNHKISISHSR